MNIHGVPSSLDIPPPRRKSVLLGAAAIALASCANPRADEALFAQQAFIGMPKQTLLSCAGVPERSTTVDNLEYFTYTSTRTVAYQSYVPYMGPGRFYGYGYGYPYYGGYAPTYDFRSFSCQATFTLRNGVVERLVYGGPEGVGPSQLAQCQTIIETCLALVPRQTPDFSPHLPLASLPPIFPAAGTSPLVFVRQFRETDNCGLHSAHGMVVSCGGDHDRP